ncbi:RNA polymerase sigma-70 factor, ECF subfamily [Streptomyces sp. 3213]|uniref:RNA polymerase sigma factor n=1 Tax=Streptomyces sp. 3213.3 TaxID=1855348 RepID=UPI00089B965E|nr:sigma-70 family RNA polymerase sigma factor [Streptomyces sp. 3213.3]SEC15338.1 RNA polymerase sigma-70 factor, ECF subfamily [Streptomyces sp. 3213] [Streptomyces sp. 3213.3]
MEDALSTDLDLADPVEISTAPLPGIELAEALHHEQYPAPVRFLLLHGASWPEAQDAAQDAFTRMCAPGLSLTYPRAWLRTVAWRSWVSQQIKPEDACAEIPEPETTLRWQTPAHAAELGEEERQVIALLLLLPAKQRAAMAWHLDGFTTEESARAMGTTQAAVRQNLTRARAALREGLCLEGRFNDERRAT